MDIEAYFARIHYQGTADPTLDTLCSLHRAHMLAIPFENLDIALKRPIKLDEESLFDKLVTRRRGGFCYEQNGLFAAALRQLGYRVTLLDARVHRAAGGFGIPFDHLTLLVELDERWLADVGYGECFLEPLRLDDPAEQERNGKRYRVRHDNTQGIYSAFVEDWVDEYLFFFQPHDLADFADTCHYHQTSPASSFTRSRTCSQATPEGRVTVSDGRVIITRDGIRQEQPLADESAFRAALRDYFGIDLDELE
jgi:N-hydroxyarylamine O-acetyltransferase